MIHNDLIYIYICILICSIWNLDRSTQHLQCLILSDGHYLTWQGRPLSQPTKMCMPPTTQASSLQKPSKCFNIRSKFTSIVAKFARESWKFQCGQIWFSRNLGGGVCVRTMLLWEYDVSFALGCPCFPLYLATQSWTNLKTSPNMKIYFWPAAVFYGGALLWWLLCTSKSLTVLLGFLLRKGHEEFPVSL